MCSLLSQLHDTARSTHLEGLVLKEHATLSSNLKGRREAKEAARKKKNQYAAKSVVLLRTEDEFKKVNEALAQK